MPATTDEQPSQSASRPVTRRTSTMNIAAAAAAASAAGTAANHASRPSLSSASSQVNTAQPATSHNGQGTIQSMNDKYEVGDVIGTGTFGIIRKVVRKSDGKILARKELDYGRMDERDLKQLSEEVNILQNLEPNDNIVRYHERYVDRNKFRLHIIMEYCHNGDLAAQIQRCRRKNSLLREDIVWSYLTQICLALSVCHAKYDKSGREKQVILHRDLKPENVFLDKDNCIKLGDFGLSKAMQTAAFTNTYVGTPYYMSPELINGTQYDAKSDIWALGCLIYEMCAWHPPFHEARTQQELTKLIRACDIPPLPPVYSRSLMDLVRVMLRTDRPSIEQIMQLDQVKLQCRVLEMKKMHDVLVIARADLTAREEQCESREQRLAERERDIAAREAALEVRERGLEAQHQMVQQLYQNFHNYQSSSSLSGSSSGTSTAPTSRDTSPLMDQKENISLSPQDISMSVNEAVAHKSLARVASRPSLVPRRPLEERRSMYAPIAALSEPELTHLSRIGLNTLTKRMSCQSLSAMAIDGETPVKSAQVTPSTETRRRIAASKSMVNLKSSGSRLESPTGRPIPPGSVSGRHAATASVTTFPAGYPARPATASGESSLNSRSDSFGSLPSITSPAKRPGHMARTATAPLMQMPQSSLGALPSITMSAPQWNFDDEDNLPSPFIKKKMSAGPLRQMTGSQTASVTSGSMRRANSSQAISSVAGGTAPPGVPSRVGRPPTTRQSLAGRLAAHRQAKTVDEQGRRLTTGA